MKSWPSKKKKKGVYMCVYTYIHIYKLSWMENRFFLLLSEDGVCFPWELFCLSLTWTRSGGKTNPSRCGPQWSSNNFPQRLLSGRLLFKTFPNTLTRHFLKKQSITCSLWVFSVPELCLCLDSYWGKSKASFGGCPKEVALHRAIFKIFKLFLTRDGAFSHL